MKWAVFTVIIASAGCDIVVHIDKLPAAPDAATGCGPWSEPLRLAINDIEINDEAPAISPDGQVLVWQRLLSDTDIDLWYAVRNGNDFTAATELTIADTDDFETGAFWSPDGSQLYFTKGPEGGAKMVMAVGPGPIFGPPVATDIVASLGYVERPRLRSDGLELVYFAHPSADLFHATRPSPESRFWTETELDTISTSEVDRDPTLTGDGLTMYFVSEATNDQSVHVFSATRSRFEEPFDTATDLGDFTIAEPSGPDLSSDGTTMVFSGYPDDQDDLYVMTRACE